MWASSVWRFSMYAEVEMSEIKLKQSGEFWESWIRSEFTARRVKIWARKMLFDLSSLCWTDEHTFTLLELLTEPKTGLTWRWPWMMSMSPWYGGIRAVIKLPGIIAVNCVEPPGVISVTRDNDHMIPALVQWLTNTGALSCAVHNEDLGDEEYFPNLFWLINCRGMLWRTFCPCCCCCCKTWNPDTHQTGAAAVGPKLCSR